MSEGTIPIKKAIPVIVLTWILSLVTALAIAYFTPFAPIGASKIGDGAVITAKIADDAIITAKLADGTVTSAKILDGSLTAVDIADGSIITVKVSDGAVTTAKIADGAVTRDKIDDEAVTTAKMEDGAVETVKIANSAIVTIKLADDSVTSAKILDGTVAAVDLADGSVITAKITNGAVTTEKIADGAVTTSKIADGNITAAKLAYDAIPYNVTSEGWWLFGPSTTSTSYVDMPGMTKNITSTRNSTLLIMFSTEAFVSDATAGLWVVANVSGTVAHPGDMGNNVGTLLVDGETDWGCYSFTFYLENVVAGTHEVKIRWHTTAGDTAYLGDRTLVVIALPA